MKKFFHIFLFALPVIAFVSCTKDTYAPEETHEKGRTLTFGFDNPETRAVETWTMERRMRSVAIFIDTDAGFFKFFSTEPEGSELSFETVELYIVRDDVTNAILTYAARVMLEIPNRVTQFKNLAIVGNYQHLDSDLTDDLKALSSWDELVAYRAPAAKRGIYLNPGHLACKVFNRNEIDDLMQSNRFEGELRRLAARIRPDFNLLVQVEDETPFPVGWTGLRDNNLFKITTLIVHNPKSATYLFPDLVSKADRTAIGQYERFEPTTFNGSSRDLYYYEMTGDELQPLVMYLIFEYRASKDLAWEQGLASIVIENTAYDGKCVLEHNHAYEVMFDMTISIPAATVSDWNTDWLVGRPKG